MRLITLDETRPDTYETETVTYFDLFSRDDPVALNLFLADSSTVPDKEHFGYFMKYVFAAIKSVFTR